MHPIMSTMRRVILVAGTSALVPALAHAQVNDSIRGAPSEANHFIETPAGWEQPTTPWGDPDIRATLNMMQAAGVPLERCAGYPQFGGTCDPNKKWLTDEEYNTRMEAARNRVDRSNQLREQGNLGGALQAGQMDPSLPQRQTNLIVDPPDGRLPDVTPEAKRLAYEMGSDWALPGENLVFESADDFDSWDRCITRGMPSMMMPYRYNGGFRIHQAPGVVVLETEMIHEARVVYTDGREPPNAAIKSWLGASRGHWEGNTLVVETTNYRDGMEINNPLINLAVIGGPPGNRFPASDQMKTTERITRLNDEVWLYEITTEDPAVLTRPFTVRYPMRDEPAYIWPEYACIEDDFIVPSYVETNRHERANPTPEPPQAPVQVSPEVADTLAGRWVGRPRIVTIDVDIELEFTKNADGTVNGKLVGTNLGEINKPLRNFSIGPFTPPPPFGAPAPSSSITYENVVRFTLPNIDPWSFTGELTDEGTIAGFVGSAQGSLPITFRRASGSAG
jgi:hypothetical protein